MLKWGLSQLCKGTAETAQYSSKGYLRSGCCSSNERRREKIVYQLSMEKSWHRCNVSNGTPKLVAPTIDAQMGRTLQTTVRKMWANTGNAKQWGWAYNRTEMCGNPTVVRVAQGSVWFENIIEDLWKSNILNGGWKLGVKRFPSVLGVLRDLR